MFLDKTNTNFDLKLICSTASILEFSLRSFVGVA